MELYFSLGKITVKKIVLINFLYFTTKNVINWIILTFTKH